jgi:hypothetical protein
MLRAKLGRPLGDGLGQGRARMASTGSVIWFFVDTRGMSFALAP